MEFEHYTYNVDEANRRRRRRRRLLEFLQERSCRRRRNTEAEEETVAHHRHQVTLSDDLIFKILILLPAETLSPLQFLCNKWFNLINSSIFIRAHAEKSETVLIRKKQTLSQPKSYFQFLDLNDGDSTFIESSLVEPVSIQASHDGLILAVVGESKRLILMNPITRKHDSVPLGRNDDNLRVESFGVGFCREASTYKVIHLFLEQNSSHIGCEILNICSRKWRSIKGPCSDSPIHIRETPLFIRGSFYWLPNEVHLDYYVSMRLEDEVFVAKKLPLKFVSKDRLMEIDGVLGFVTHAKPGVLQVWVLIEDGLGETWVNRNVVDLMGFDVGYPIPVCSSRNGRDLVLGGGLGSDLYVYGFDSKVVRSTYDDQDWYQSINEWYIPHRHTLVSWELGLS